MGVLSPLKTKDCVLKSTLTRAGVTEEHADSLHDGAPVNIRCEAQPNSGWFKRPKGQKAPEVSAVANGVTTLMMYDLPVQMAVNEVMDMINNHGFADSYNFVYMPPSIGGALESLGHAYVNFRTAESAEDFLAVFQRFVCSHGNSRNLIRTKPMDGHCCIMSDIPCQVTVKQVVGLIDEHGFVDTYDFVYMPTPKEDTLERNQCAFINFKTAEFADKFHLHLSDFSFSEL